MFSCTYSHEWKNGICKNCNTICFHQWINDICTICNLKCNHPSHDAQTFKCTSCQATVEHDLNENNTCKLCKIKISYKTEKMPCVSQNGNIYGVLFLPDSFLGKLKTVIVSHGFNVNASNAMAARLAMRGYACYIFDFCGGSPTSRSDMAFEDMTILTEKNDLLAVYETISTLSFVDKNNIYLYGESQGGLVTALTAVELKNEIAGTILIYPGFSMISSIAMQYQCVDDLPEYVTVIDKTLKRTYAEAIFEFLPKKYEKIDNGLTKEEILMERLKITRTLYEHISCFKNKVLIIHGTADPMVEIDFSRKALEYFNNAKLIEVKGAVHGFTGDQLDKNAKFIDEFIKNE